jgi:hypothetical protein
VLAALRVVFHRPGDAPIAPHRSLTDAGRVRNRISISAPPTPSPRAGEPSIAPAGG